MIILRTAEEVEAFLQTPLGHETEPIIRPHLERLAEYVFDEIASIAISDGSGSLREIGLEPEAYEYLDVHPGWTEAVYIVSDDGFGWIVLTPG